MQPTSAATHYMGAGDTLPYFTSILKDGNGTAVNLAQPGTGVVFKMRPYGKPTAPVVGGDAVIDVTVPGHVYYIWHNAEATEGIWECQWQVTFPDGKAAHFPNRGYDVLYVSPVLPAPAA